MACERDILPERLLNEIRRFFEAHLAWLERVLEAGLRGGTVQRGALIPPRLQGLCSRPCRGRSCWGIFPVRRRDSKQPLRRF
jgi:hypothetical protein